MKGRRKAKYREKKGEGKNMEKGKERKGRGK